jgi:hypothetical protein
VDRGFLLGFVHVVGFPFFLKITGNVIRVNHHASCISSDAFPLLDRNLSNFFESRLGRYTTADRWCSLPSPISRFHKVVVSALTETTGGKGKIELVTTLLNV